MRYRSVAGGVSRHAEQVVVRRCTDEDLPRCVRALAQVHAEDDYPTRWPADPVGWLSPTGWAAAWVAGPAGTVVGHACVVRGVDDPVVTAITGAPPERLAMVSRLFVAPSGRGQGWGASLLDAACSYASTQRLQLMLDVVQEAAPAVALYERMGWQLVDHRVTDWTTPAGRRLPVRVYVAPPGDSATNW